MKSKMENNLFYYATSEPSHNTLICNLMSIALEDAKKNNSILRSCAKSLLAVMVPKLAEDQVVLTDVKWQENHIDVQLIAVCAQCYQTVLLVLWELLQIYGFYDMIQNSDFPDEKQVWMKYAYVANCSGGFENLCIGLEDDFAISICGVFCELYLQYENFRWYSVLLLWCKRNVQQ